MIVDVAALSARISAKTVWTFVRARDAAGRTGWGEATLQGEAAAIHAHVARLAQVIVHRPLPAPLAAAAMAGTLGGSAAEAAAISAVDQALWDIAAQERGQPLAHALGSPRRSTIELYANINRGTLERSPAGFATRAQAAASGGFAAIKIAPFDDVRQKASRRPRAPPDGGPASNASPRCATPWGPSGRCWSTVTGGLPGRGQRDPARLEPLRLYWFECPLPEEPGTLPRCAGCARRPTLPACGWPAASRSPAWPLSNRSSTGASTTRSCPT
ncbi:MAG: hypothetical protein IPI73_25385 [Betaproteobacteria bacterium]|nr:hypothetical protein [Betaproteobacteria bacterium]